MKRRKTRRPSAEAEEPVLNISGYLEKKSKRGAWQKRWFFTSHTYLMYAKTEGSASLGGVDLMSADAQIEPRPGIDGFRIPSMRITGPCADQHDGAKGEERAMRTFELREHITEVVSGASPSLEEWIDALERTRTTLLAQASDSGAAASDIATAGKSAVAMRMAQAEALERGMQPSPAQGTIDTDAHHSAANALKDARPRAALVAQAPVAEVPANDALTADAPTTGAPVDEAPADEAHDADDTASHALEDASLSAVPVTQAPEAPVDKSSVANEHASEARVDEAPIVDDALVTRASAAESSVTKAPVAEEPATEAPVDEAAIDETPAPEAVAFVSKDPDGSRFDATPMSPVSPSTPRQPRVPPSPPAPAETPHAPSLRPSPAQQRSPLRMSQQRLSARRESESEHEVALERAKSEWKEAFAARAAEKAEHDDAVVAALREELESQRREERAAAAHAARALSEEAAVHMVELHAHAEATQKAEEAARQFRADLARANSRAATAAMEAEELLRHVTRDSAAAAAVEAAQADQTVRSADRAAACAQARAAELELNALRADLETLRATADVDHADLERVTEVAAAAAIAADVASKRVQAHDRDNIALMRAAAAIKTEQLNAEAAAAESEAHAAKVQLAKAQDAMASLEEVNGADHAALARAEARAAAAAADAAQHERDAIAAVECTARRAEATLDSKAEAAVAEAHAAELTLAALRAEMAAVQAEHNSEIARISQHAHDVEAHVGLVERAQLEWESVYAARAAAQTASAVAAATEELRQESSVMRDVIEANRAHEKAERSAKEAATAARGQSAASDAASAAVTDTTVLGTATGVGPSARGTNRRDLFCLTPPQQSWSPRKPNKTPSVHVSRHGSISISAGGAALIALPTSTPPRESQHTGASSDGAALLHGSAMAQPEGDVGNGVLTGAPRRNGEMLSRSRESPILGATSVLAQRRPPGLVLRGGAAQAGSVPRDQY